MFVVVKSVVGVVPPVQLVWFRYLVGVLVLGAYCLGKHMEWRWNRRDLVLIVLIGLIGNTFSIVAQETGTWLSSAQMGSVITAASPTFMLFFAWWMLKEKITLGNGLSIALATVGVLMIVGIHVTGHNALLGSLAFIVAAITWALMSVLIEMVSPRFNATQIGLLAAVVAVVALTPYVLSPAQLPVLTRIPLGEPGVWLSFLYIGAISTSLANVMWARGLQILGSAESGLYFLLQPVVGTLLGWLLLGESITWGFLAGAVLIGVSMWISIRFGSSKAAARDAGRESSS